jgi:hypothetical protein
VPVAILSGTRGKPPPILAARFASPLAFPFEFELTDENLTPEGAPSEGSSSGERWWARDDLVYYRVQLGMLTMLYTFHYYSCKNKELDLPFDCICTGGERSA